MSILDNALLVGSETTYGTAAALTRSYEATSDSWKRDQDVMDSTGFRVGLQTKRSDRRRVVNMGGEGDIELTVLDQSMLMLFDAAFGTTAGPTGAGDAKSYTFATSTAEPSRSMTIQMLRSKVDGGVDAYTHTGSVVKTFTLTQDMSALLMAKLEFDCQDVKTDVAAGTPQFVNGARPFAWEDCIVTVNGDPVDAGKFEFVMDHQLKTDRRYLRGTALKKQPRKGGLPGLTGSLDADYEDNTLYNLWTTGAIFPVTATWTGLPIGNGTDAASVSLTLPACQFTGDGPVASLDDLTKQSMAFDVLDNGTAPAASLVVVTSDSAL